MQFLVVSGAVRPLYGSLGVKGLRVLWQRYVSRAGAGLRLRNQPFYRLNHIGCSAVCNDDRTRMALLCHRLRYFKTFQKKKVLISRQRS